MLGFDDVDDATIEPFAGHGLELQQVGDVVACIRHRGVAESQHQAMRGVGDELDRGSGDDAERPFGAGEEFRDVEAVLGQQVLERVSRDLAREPAELRADRAEVPGDELAQFGEVVAPEGEEASPAVDDLQLDDVVRHASVAERAWAAGVVADHAADGAAARCRRIRAETQPVGACGDLQLVLDDARVDDRGLGLGVDRVDAVQVFGGVDDQPWADGIAGARGTRTSCRDGDLVLQSPAHGLDEFLASLRPDDAARLDSVEGPVRGVQGAGEGGRIDGQHAPIKPRRLTDLERRVRNGQYLLHAASECCEILRIDGVDEDFPHGIDVGRCCALQKIQSFFGECGLDTASIGAALSADDEPAPLHSGYRVGQAGA